MLTNQEIALRLILSTLVGGIIGIEREVNKRPAGIRTHILVTLGSTLVMLISSDALMALGSEIRFDPGRIAAQVISGIGFLGAGTILRMGNTIVGLTTAASLWVSAAIGLALGAGYYFAGVMVGLIAVVTLVFVRVVERYQNRNFQKTLTISLDGSRKRIDEIKDSLTRMGIKIKNMDLVIDNVKKTNLEEICQELQELKIVFTLIFPSDIDYNSFFGEIYQIHGVISVDLSNGPREDK